MKSLIRSALLCSALLLPGCATYKIPTSEFYERRPMGKGEIIDYPKEKQGPEIYERRKAALDHWLYRCVPRHRAQIRFWDLGHWSTWVMFGNDDDGLFGEEGPPQEFGERPINLQRALAWYVRNPLHNTTFYVLGIAWSDPSEFVLLTMSEDGTEFLKYRKKAKTVMAGEKGASFWIGFHGWLPFISFRIDHVKRTNFYIGWRDRGNLGFKFQPFKRIPKLKS